jgi:hypothetical protein
LSLVVTVLTNVCRAPKVSSLELCLNAEGPECAKLRGGERKEFRLNDQTTGDVYRCVLLALRQDPAALTISYDEMLSRIRAVCTEDTPTGSSVSFTLGHMTTIAEGVQEAPVIEWEADTLHIIEPYFLLFLRNSHYLSTLASPAVSRR